MIFGELGFHTAVTFAVTRQEDFPFDVNSGGGERVVIVLHSVIHVDDRSGGFAGWRVAIEGGGDALVGGVFVGVDGRLGRGEFLGDGLCDFERDFARHGEPGAVDDDVGVEAEAAVLVAQPFGDTMAGFGAGHVRLAGEAAEIFSGAGGVGYGAELLLKFAFGGNASGREAGDTRVGSGILRAPGANGEGEQHDRHCADGCCGRRSAIRGLRRFFAHPAYLSGAAGKRKDGVVWTGASAFERDERAQSRFAEVDAEPSEHAENDRDG